MFISFILYLFLDRPTASADGNILAPLHHPNIIVCNLTGYPQTIYWFKDQIKLIPDDISLISRNVEITSMSILQATLQFPTVLESDYGIYQCKGSNNFGVDSATISLESKFKSIKQNYKEVEKTKTKPKTELCCFI